MHVYLLLDNSYIYYAIAPKCRWPCFTMLQQAMMHAEKTNAFTAKLKAMELVNVVQVVT